MLLGWRFQSRVKDHLGSFTEKDGLGLLPRLQLPILSPGYRDRQEGVPSLSAVWGGGFMKARVLRSQSPRQEPGWKRPRRGPLAILIHHCTVAPPS